MICIALCYVILRTFHNYKPHLGNPSYLSFWVFTSKCLTQASCPNRSVFGDPSSLNCLGPQSPLCGLVYGIPKSILGQELSHQEWDTMISHRLRGYSEISGGFKCWFLSVPTWRKWVPNFPSPLTCKIGHLGPPGLMPMMVPTANCPPACPKLTGRKFFSGLQPFRPKISLQLAMPCYALLCHYIWKAFNITTKKFPDTPAMPGNVSEKCKSDGKSHTSGYIKGGKIAMPFPTNRMLRVAFEGRNHVLSNWKFHVDSIIWSLCVFLLFWLQCEFRLFDARSLRDCVLRECLPPCVFRSASYVSAEKPGSRSPPLEAQNGPRLPMASHGWTGNLSWQWTIPC